MRDKRLVIVLTFGVIFSLVALSGVLIFFEKGGSAQFNILGQEFSSTNIGLAVLALAIFIFIYVVRDLYNEKTSPENGKVYKYLNNDSITWSEVIEGCQKLVLQLTASNGFRPDLVIGICGGGLVVADIISKRLGHIPCLSIWANRHNLAKEPTFDGRWNTINQIDFEEIFSENSMKRILIIDDVVYSGETLASAVKFVSAASKSIRSGKAEIRTASLFAITSAKHRPDFVAMVDARDRKMMPVSDRLRPGA